VTAGRDTVLFVNHAEYFGGSAMSLRTLLSHLDPGVRRALASPAAGPVTTTLAAELRLDDRIELPTLGLERPRVMALARCALRLAWSSLRMRGRLIAIHANGLAEMATATIAAAVTRRPLVVWVHDTDIRSRRSRRVVRLAERLTRVKWVAVSMAAKDQLVEHGRARPSRVTVIPNPIEPDSVLAARDRGSGCSYPATVGFLGTDTMRKGFDLLPAIWGRVGRADARLEVFANRHSDLPPIIERSWTQLGALPSVDLHGRLDDVRIAYGSCDVVLCPSRDESFGRVVAEAMLNGIPIVAANLPAIRELVADDAGLLFPSGDVEAAASDLRRMLDDSGLRTRLGAAGRRRAATFAPSDVTRRFEAVYRGRA
jgi:glycosyltransferase involved in cell wall biosynthesis